MARNNIKIR